MRRTTTAAMIGACALAIAVIGTPVQAQSSRPTVAILDLDYGTIQQWWSGNWDIGKGIADMIVDELVNDGSYRMIERKRLDAIMAEQNFSNSDRADPSAASVATIGKALGVKYLIVGSITKFGTPPPTTGPGSASKKPGLAAVGEPSGLRNGRRSTSAPPLSPSCPA